MVIKSNTALGVPLIVTVVTTAVITLGFFSAAAGPDVWPQQKAITVNAPRKKDFALTFIVETILPDDCQN